MDDRAKHLSSTAYDEIETDDGVDAEVKGHSMAISANFSISLTPPTKIRQETTLEMDVNLFERPRPQ